MRAMRRRRPRARVAPLQISPLRSIPDWTGELRAAEAERRVPDRETAAGEPRTTGMQALTQADEVVLASRALLAIVARTTAPALEEVSLPQFRVLVVLVGAGPHRVGALAERLDVLPSTFSRALDRLEQGGWVARVPSTESRREVLVEPTERARALVGAVTEGRRREIATVLDRLPDDRRSAVAGAFREFADAADEPAMEDLLTLGT